MSDKERKTHLEDFKKYLKKETATKELSQKFLIKLGVHTKNGRLTKKYSQV